MSRCFPFPPPGYEHTARTENLDLQLKENHKSKKDKKEKRENDKKEGKEKRQKDKSRDKHGEKNDRKEKHKDKDRKKDRDKEKDKKDRERKTKEPAANLQIGYRHEEERAANIKSGEPIKDFKLNEGLYRTKEETTRTGSKVTDELRARCIAGETPDIRKVRDAAVNRSLTGNEQLEGLGNMAREQVIGNNMAGIFVSAEQRNNSRNTHENGGLLGKYGSEKTHRMEKTKDSEADVRNRERHKDKSKKIKGEDKIKLKNPTKDIANISAKRMRDTSEHKAVEKRNIGEDVKNGHDRQGIKPIVLPKKIEKNSGFDGNLKKKKQLNGFSHEYATQPIKLALLTQPPLDDVLCRVSTFNHNREGKQVETITDNKGHTANGFVNPKPFQVTSSKSTSGINGVPTKPPHPDIKYLDKVLSVPTMEELPETDKQEWLFSGGDGMERREAKRVKADETAHVWAKAQRIIEADILAMPYVIPY